MSTQKDLHLMFTVNHILFLPHINVETLGMSEMDHQTFETPIGNFYSSLS
jgi:hypothetical protein